MRFLVGLVPKFRTSRKITLNLRNGVFPFVRNSFVRTALVRKSFVRIAICYNFHSLEIAFIRKTYPRF